MGVYGFYHRGSMYAAGQSGAMPQYLSANRAEGDKQWNDNSVCLGFRQMSTPAESTKDLLPWYDAASGQVITADVCLDNRSGLAKIFAIPLSELPTMGDSLLLLKAYQKWGTACPQHLVGDYAFAIWNPAEKTLFCARDHIGAKPFYYSLSAEQFVFATDINRALDAQGISDQWDDAYLAACFHNKFFVHDERTFFKSIRKLKPGHSLTIRPDTISLDRHWFPEQAPTVHFASDTDYVEAFLEIYTRVIKDCVTTLHPVGCHLSGGLDSSSIAVLAARELRSQGKPAPSVYCWQPAPEINSQAKDDQLLIEKVCAQEQLTPHYLTLHSEDYLKILKRDITREPAEMTLYAEEPLQRMAASQGVRVLLSGWGGDEGISHNGRRYYPDLLRQGQLGRLWRASPGNPFKFISRQLLTLLFSYEFRNRIRKWKKGKWAGPAAGMPYLHPEFSQRIKPLRNRPFYYVGVRGMQLQLLNHGHITARMEAWAANGDRHNIVYRYPLVDRRLLEFTLGLPPEQFVRGEWRRWLMRDGFDGILPDEVRWHKSKEDPVRSKVLMDLLPIALNQVGQSLAARPVPSSRSVYLNMPRLIEDLTTNLDHEKCKPARFSAALQFLDW